MQLPISHYIVTLDVSPTVFELLTHLAQKGVRSFGRQDVWATNYFPNVHLGDTKLDVWATKVNR